MQLTDLLAQLLGTILVVIGLSILFKKKMFMHTVKSIEHNELALYVLGLLSLIVGTLIVLIHNFWTMGTLALVVTIIGWLFVLRGIIIMVISEKYFAALVRWAKVEELSWFYALIAILIGLYLMYGGFVTGM